MGVLKFTSWLLRQQSKFNVCFKSNKLTTNVNNFYIDANSTIYEVYNNIKGKEIKDNNKLEKLLIESVIKYYDYLISIVKPKNIVYISFDGVVPFSKITQQRIRRYSNIEDTNWNPNSNISPMTPFMKKLDEKLNKYCIEHKYLYSSTEQFGEGEHKIIQFIKNHSLTHQNDINVIYGNDTDIIFLSLISNIQFKSNIILFKTIDNHNIFFDVNNIKQLIKNMMIEETHKQDFSYDINDVNVIDFIVLCFLIGNDFLQHIPFIDAYKLKFIISSYVIGLKNNNILTIMKDDKTKINYENLNNVLKILSTYELKLFKDAYYDNQLMIKKEVYNSKYPSSKNKEIEEIRIKQKDYDYFDNIIVKDDLTTENSLLTYKFNYYNYYLHSNNKFLLNQMFYNYFEGFNWTVDYYFNSFLGENKFTSTCLDYEWFYRFNCVPFISDIYQYLNDNIDISFENKITEPLTSKQQLFYIIPSKFLKDIDKSIYDELIKYDFINKLDNHIDTIHKKKLWECHNLVSLINCDVIKELIN